MLQSSTVLVAALIASLAVLALNTMVDMPSLWIVTHRGISGVIVAGLYFLGKRATARTLHLDDRVGKLSYPVYLVHVAVGMIVVPANYQFTGRIESVKVKPGAVE